MRALAAATASAPSTRPSPLPESAGACRSTSVKLLAPIANPGKLIAVAGGYLHPRGRQARQGRDPDALRKADRRHQRAPATDHDLEDVARRRRRDRGRDRHRQGGQGHPASRAMDHVFGYTICNDVSGRELAVPAARPPRQGDGRLPRLAQRQVDGRLRDPRAGHRDRRPRRATSATPGSRAACPATSGSTARRRT